MSRIREEPPRAGYPLVVPRVAAAIVTHNKRDAVLQLLSRLGEVKVPAFVTVNACRDGTADAIRASFPRVSVLESDHNLGGTGGFNCAVLAALSTGAPYIVLADDDALPDPDCLDRLADFLDGHPAYAFAAPAVYIAGMPGILQETGGSVLFSRDVPVEAWNRFRKDPPLPPHLDIGYASACLLMVRSSAVAEWGVMDWNYFIFSDDVDWSLRLTRAVGKGVCVTGAKALHDFPWAKPFVPMRLYYFQRNGLYLISRWQAGDPLFISLRRSLLRLFRAWLAAAAAGDHEISRTLRSAFSDSCKGRLGRWREPVEFPAARRRCDSDALRKERIRRVLLNFRIEDFIPEGVALIRELLGERVVIDVLCDAWRVGTFTGKESFGAVHGRAVGRVGQLRQFFRLRRLGYDLTVSDAFMEPRGPADMTGRLSAFYHMGALFEAPRRPVRTLLSTVFAHTLGAIMAWLTCWKFMSPPTEGTPPEEARSLLDRIGVDPKAGQPWRRPFPLPFSAPPDPAPFYGTPLLRRIREGIRRSTRRVGLGGAGPYIPPATAPSLGAGEEAGGYREWCESREEWAPRRHPPAPRGERLLFSVLVPVFETKEAWLRECIDSVLSQSWAEWELILADDGSKSAHVERVLSEAAKRDPRIRLAPSRERGGISAATNRAAAMARGEYLLFLDHDDLLDPFALAAFTRALEETGDGGQPVGILYADEDRFDESRARFWPGFKPSWSPERLLGTNYIHHPVVIRRALFEKLGGLRREFDGSQDHDLLLRAAESGERVVHVPDILYHMRFHPGSLVADPEAKPLAHRRDITVISEALRRRGETGRVEPVPENPGYHTIHRSLPEGASTSVLIIPEGDGPATPELERRWPGCEVLVARPGEGVPERLNALASLATGDLLVTTTSRVTPEGGWREAILPHAVRPEIGAVTGKVSYCDGRLYACGLVVGVAGSVGRFHYGVPSGSTGYGGGLILDHEIWAVPWRFLVIRKDLFFDAGGFDSAFTLRGFDVDLSLRLWAERGRRNLAVPRARSILREKWPGPGMEPWDAGDLALLWKRWGRYLGRGDPYSNPNISLYGEGFSFIDQEENDLRRRGVFIAYDGRTASLMAERFGESVAPP